MRTAGDLFQGTPTIFIVTQSDVGGEPFLSDAHCLASPAGFSTAGLISLSCQIAFSEPSRQPSTPNSLHVAESADEVPSIFRERESKRAGIAPTAARKAIAGHV